MLQLHARIADDGAAIDVGLAKWLGALDDSDPEVLDYLPSTRSLQRLVQQDVYPWHITVEKEDVHGDFCALDPHNSECSIA